MIKINLQLFSEGEKTEEPTPKKRREAREEGQILQSKEVNNVVILFACFFGLKLFGGIISSQLQNLITSIFHEIQNVESFFNASTLNVNALKIMSIFGIMVFPILGVAFLSSLIVNYMQVGFIFTTKTLKLKLDRLNPIEGFKKIISKKALMELVKSILKIILVGYVAYKYIMDNILEIIQYSSLEPHQSYISFANLIFSFVLRLLGVLMVLAILDYIFQWREHENKLKMSKQEVKEEYKQTEGDPFIKGKIKEKQRSIAMNRMMQEVPQADVIITNPTHYAVAIKYDNENYDAPYVLGKGVDIIAENIKKVAKENSLPIVENKLLARTLYNTVDIGDVIPEDLYEAVAEVLAYVYGLKNEV